MHRLISLIQISVGTHLLSESILSDIEVDLALVLFIDLVVDLIVQPRHGLQTVLAGVDHYAGLGLLFIREHHLLCLRAELLGQVALEEPRVVTEHVLEGDVKVEQSLARAEAYATFKRTLDALEEMEAGPEDGKVNGL